MESRGTHFVKNQESLPITNESQLKKKIKKKKEFPTKLPGWDLSHSSKFGIFVGIL